MARRVIVGAKVVGIRRVRVHPKHRHSVPDWMLNYPAVTIESTFRKPKGATTKKSEVVMVREADPIRADAYSGGGVNPAGGGGGRCRVVEVLRLGR